MSSTTQAGKKRHRCCIYLHSGSYDRVHQAASIANVVLAMGGEVHIFCSYGAVKRLRKGCVDDVVIEGEGAPFAEDFAKNLERGSIDPISELLEVASMIGVFKLYACSASMATLNITRDELIDAVDATMGLVGFQELVRGADQVLYI